ncbi:MAG TPA: serine/threonine-protein kinase [Gemmatimonadales bacterium]|nr:serine/threonine-protein kinase [Gemmatimonadales bacterium]
MAPITDSLERIRAALAGRYDIERKLGEGGMAIVYLARDVRLDRTVAIKVLRGEVALALGGDRFLREIKLASHLQHPNILAVWDSGDADGILYFVMPFITGESLRDKLDREKQLSLEDAISITREVADALHYAHAQGIVHRDVKPENILIEQGHAILADFGIARAASESGNKLTETGMSVGTPTYMSPEQSMGGEGIDGRSDQYSLGCVLYEMLAGQPPFDGNNTMAILAKHSMEAVPSLQIVRKSIPDDIEDIVMQSLEKTPADRFRTMKDMSDALAAADISLAARRTPTRGGIRRPSGVSPRASGRVTGRFAAESGSSRKKIAGLAAIAAAVVVGGGFFALRQLKAGDAPPAGPDTKRIAVMYFDTRGGDSLQFLADGLTEALIGQLSQVEPLTVISRNGVDGLRGAEPDSVARTLNVGTLVQGRVEQAGDMLRLTVAMLDEKGEEIRGSRTTIDRPRGDIFALQDTLAAEVAMFLRRRLGDEVEVQQTRAGTRDVAAWEALQRAREEGDRIDQLVGTGDAAAVDRQFDRVDSMYATVARMDDKWSTPHTQRAWLAFQRVRIAIGSGDRTAAGRWLDAGRGHAETAVQLSARSPEADALEARATLTYWRWMLGLEPDPDRGELLLDSAEADFRGSIAANPGQASALTSLAHLLVNRGRVAEAQLAATEAYEKDPYLSAANTTVWRLFGTSLDLGDEINSQRWCEEGQRRFPDDARFVECQLKLFGLKNFPPDIPKAWQLLDRYVELSAPEVRDFRRLRGEMLVAIALVRAGREDSARSVMERVRSGTGDLDPTRELQYFEAIANTMLGDQDRAFELLATYIAVNPSQRRSFRLDKTWWLEPLRDDPRYARLSGPAS